ncbi:hypothetical protein I3J09_02070 [Streptomyces clavuligerus]|uniref:NAD(P)-dependent oxidoreductase n=1 Tax=Streptomyces clavuligerus TaxID=1901 RepID=UPI000810691A|nr:NAD(P)-dependent oxidoreductase [Streptomyces clavuligerus]ANW17095.1 hypothetical protein BB341_02095 [Streptomyces clavuligerus]AXU11634.1 hypothetical protein D1794_02200 [Streptomyces clavuligerus]MBY6301468.1 hypothetical protein [Streptomyces clavuligerus]QPL61754.1 hypothetical protein I3J04_02070 [Streptomyces clavuligerus]QPL67787.1 hypothetical protein I3J05_02085 [Streptomyces clavuligerus]
MARQRISGAVMTHPQRLPAAEALARSAPPGALRVVMDPDPGGRPSVLRTALAAWSSIEDGATHQLVVQDDMILSDTFFERVRDAVAERPDAALALFALWDSRNGAAVRFGALTGARWVRAVGEYFPCVAIVLPRAVAAGYVAYGSRRLDAWPDDILMRQYLRTRGIPSYVSVPSLAEHDDRGSISGNAFRGPRRAVCFLPDDPADGERNSLEELRAVPFFKHGVAQCAVRVPGPGPERWLHLESEDYLAGMGIHADSYKSAKIELTEVPEPQTARGTWLTAFTMGFVHRIEGRGDSVSQTPICAEALATIGPGGMSHHRGEERIAELREELAVIARAGLAAGLAAGAEREAYEAPPRTGRRVAVVGAASPLGEHVVRGLTDRGHRVTLLSATAAGHHRAGDALVDLRPLREETRPARTGVLVRLPDPATGAPRPPVLLRTGDLYGPGCSPYTPIGRMVWSALRSRPVTVTEPPGRPLRPLHTYDLVGAVARLLEQPTAKAQAPGVLELPDPEPVGERAMAEAVRAAVRPVEIETVAAPAPAGPRGTTGDTGPAPGAPRPQGWKPAMDLHHGLHTFMQWLAYEGLGHTDDRAAPDTP